MRLSGAKLLPALCVFLSLLAGCAPKAAVRVTAPVTEAGCVERLRADLARIFSDDAFAGAQWGVEVVSLDRGERLFEHNAARLYMPASNNKLLTTAAALVRLGPDFRYETKISTDGELSEGTFKGNLVITGSGDPTLAPRFHEGDPFRVFKDWASRLKEKGIRKIQGELLGDARAFPPPFIGPSWEWDDLVYGYAAPVSALQFNENLFSLVVTPGEKEGTPARIKCTPLPDYVTIDSRVATVARGTKGRIEVQRGESRESITVSGTIAVGADPDTTSLAVELPTLYYLTALRKTLQEEGIDVASADLHAIENPETVAPVAGQVLWSHASPPLSEIIKPLLKVSQNLYAETLARTLGLSLRNQGTFDAGRDAIQETLERMAIQKGTYAYVDGSGLSRQNLVSADLLIRIFKFMARQKYFPFFYEALPIAGVDGTIRSRMRGTKAENNVHAKTGSIAYVRSLSGYLKSADGEMLVFSMIANNFLASNQAAEYVQDAALERLAAFRRKE